MKTLMLIYDPEILTTIQKKKSLPYFKIIATNLDTEGATYFTAAIFADDDAEIVNNIIVDICRDFIYEDEKEKVFYIGKRVDYLPFEYDFDFDLCKIASIQTRQATAYIGNQERNFEDVAIRTTNGELVLAQTIPY